MGTDLWFAAVTKFVGGPVDQTKGTVDWQVLRRLWLGSVPATVATLLWMHHTGIAQTKPRFLLVALGAVLLLTAVAMLFMSRVHRFAATLRTSSRKGLSFCSRA